ncbi:enoyl-CoA hydratase-related protein [Mycobacterium sp. Aquia_216]|uniref:enoyl-CoA hydratase-related protein n=1 Tax=Mycobacterium sp. Aquia_216 TaxID=2991729 RepID=UPI00227BBD69|nr:enoyl-CoA hydratase-related protein [Mycobacterium sp. Aquia_216]WAJ43274.1 enoyl-CoA hydratase-related protein [Mycobacterium sp. Aquia_216]
MAPDAPSRPDEANVAAVRSLYRALAAGDREMLGQLLHPDFIGRATAGLPLGVGGEHVGPEAMRRQFWWELGRHYDVAAYPDTFHALDDGRLLVAGRYRGEARRSGKKLDAPFHHVISFADDGRMTSLDQLTDSALWVDALDEQASLQTIDYDVTDGVATICLNRPKSHNAIDLRMAVETLVVARRVADDRSVRAVLICGDGPSLSVGGDIKSFPADPSTAYGDLLHEMTTPFHEAFRVLSRIDAPIVTAAHGAVAGGGLGYVYAADLAVAAEGTRFLTAFAALGLTGDGGGTWHLPRLIGARRAAQAYLRNTPIEADEALEWGLINEVVPADELRARALTLATELAQGPTRAFAKMRALLRDSWHSDVATQLKSETDALSAAANTADAAEALSAFRAKRTPRFTGG